MKELNIKVIYQLFFSMIICTFSQYVVGVNSTAPCPPGLSMDGEIVEQECGTTGFPDTEYGPTQIVDGQCPSIPGEFSKTYLVNNFKVLLNHSLPDHCL